MTQMFFISSKSIQFEWDCGRKYSAVYQFKKRDLRDLFAFLFVKNKIAE